ncbi:DUF547 domain-containing protein [Aureispira anguillae]|uniref:DUF547 domain-containing protein n=1 Tax=Aureispira anguillae TaxID=2864201 RepID=A0A916DTF1_9BACT|nr:DUF547 domain-containing protein [Aureispira anguillae]BDS11742.1 DUF547 domain-containing protein [Aureispira anguillae]
MRTLTSILFFSCLFLSLTSKAAPIKDAAEFFNHADDFFKNYAINGNIKYANLKQDPSNLQPLIDFIGLTPVKSIDVYRRKAYLINCYNLVVIKAVLDNYPIKKVKDTNKFFKKDKHKIGNEMITLDHLEYKIIFKEYKDPRLHFVLVCAAKGCPPIPSFAYTPGDLNYQINKQCQLALDNPNFLYLEDKDGIVKLSPIFKWYKNDFFPSIIDFINAHRSQKLPSSYTLDYYEYDWNLNAWEEL